MKKAIIRPLWGAVSENDGNQKNRKAINATIDLVLSDRFQVPFVVYALGDDNVNYLKEKGVKVVKVGGDPLPRGSRRSYIHRMDVCHAALQDYDEIVCLNWNCRLTKEFSEDFWSILGRKEELQAPLMRTRIKLLNNRENDRQNKTFPNDSFVYMRNKNLPTKILKTLDYPIPNKWTPESLMAAYLDDYYGKWIGDNGYREKHEPEVVDVGRFGVFKKDSCFKTRKEYKWKKI